MSKKLFFLISIVLVLGMASTGSARLEGYWPFDGDASDVSGGGLHGTLMGDPAPVFAEGIIGQALDTTQGAGPDYVELTGFEGLQGRGAFSVAMWIKTSDDGTLIGWGTNAGGTSRFELRVIGGPRLRAESSGNIQGDTVFAADEWVHVAFTKTENGVINDPDSKLYLNGVDDTRTSTGSNNQLNLGPGNNVAIARRHTSGREFDGLIDELQLYSRELTAEEVQEVMNGGVIVWPEDVAADRPSPADGALIEEASVTLGWRAGVGAVAHDVYFGTAPDLGPDQLVSQQQTDTQYLADGIVPDQTYYWRIDETDADGVVATGDVWSFWTPVMGSRDPQPADGVVILDNTASLTWTAGWSPIMHQVYFGTDAIEVANAADAPLVADIGYDTGELQPDTTYYWRVDEFYGAETVKGAVWSFSTVPVLPAGDDPNLVVHYTFDQMTSNVALDESGNANHGVLFDGAELTTGGPSGDMALDLEGQFEYVAISGLHYDNAPQAETTVSAWIRTDLGSNQTIASFDRNEYWRFQINGEVATDGQIGWHMYTDAQSDYGSVRRVDDGIWHHVCGVYDNGEQIIYIDGVAEPSVMSGTTFGRNVRWGYIGTGSEAGVYNGTPRTPADHFNGQIDDFRIYDRALTPDEIQQLGRLNPAQAWNPTPIGASSGDILTMASLAWQPGDGATEHFVFFGTDPDAVAAADVLDTTGIYRGFQAEASYVIPEKLDFESNYYWRVDERSLSGASVVLTAGRIWSFSTEAELVIFDTETPFDYDTSADPFVSDISLDLDPALDLTDPIGRVAVSYTGNAAAGSVAVDEAAGTTTVVGRGADIWGTSDEFQYAYTTLTGNGSMTVKVDSLAFTDPWTKAGIMIRETLDPGSSFAMVAATGENGVRFQARAMADQSATADDAVATDEAKALAAPVWIKIERMFPMINAYYSTDGVTFTPMSWNPQVIPMTPAPIFIGLAVTSHSGAETYADAVFSELSSDGGVAPGPLSSAEIGLTGNSAAPMYLVLDDASGASAAVLNPDPDATLQTSATDFVVDLRDVGIDLSAVTKVSLVIGDLDAPAPGGSGSLTIHNVRLLAGIPRLSAAYAFGSRLLEVATYNDPSVSYTMVHHGDREPETVQAIQYDPAKGYGYEVLYPTDSPFGERRGFGIFGPFDDSPNNRNEFPDDGPEQVYDSFIGAKSFTNEVSAATMGDMDTPSPDPEGIIFRVDVPNGFYRFVAAVGEADNPHAHRLLAEDGGSGPPANIGSHVVLVHNHDQNQQTIGEIEGDEPGDAVFARVGFDGKIPPPGDGLPPSPSFVDMDENGMATDAGANSPILEVTQGYIRIHQLQGNSNDGPGGSNDANGGDIVILELWQLP